jgi:hypothetical protein
VSAFSSNPAHLHSSENTHGSERSVNLINIHGVTSRGTKIALVEAAGPVVWISPWVGERACGRRCEQHEIVQVEAQAAWMACKKDSIVMVSITGDLQYNIYTYILYIYTHRHTHTHAQKHIHTHTETHTHRDTDT